jgi:hypothetical protein
MISPMHDEAWLTNDAIRAWAAERLRTVGANGAARELGVGRETLLSLAVGAPVQDGTFAKIRERRRLGPAKVAGSAR